MPVMIPGSASGSTSRNEIASRPKNLKRWTRERRRRAEHQRDRGREQRRPDRQPERVAHLLVVPGDANHFVEKPVIGQLWTFDVLNA